MAAQSSSDSHGRSGGGVGSERDCSFRGLRVAEELCLRPAHQYSTSQVQDSKSKILRTKPYVLETESKPYRLS